MSLSRRRARFDKQCASLFLALQRRKIKDDNKKLNLDNYPSTFACEKKIKAYSSKKHENNVQSGGIESFLPSLIGLTVFLFIFIAKSGFRGRANVAGIDLGTSNSVICVQEQSKGVGKIECIPDPFNDSPIIPSVVSIRDTLKINSEYKLSMKFDRNLIMYPHPSKVIVGSAAKLRIKTYPHHTLYHAKRVIGRIFDDKNVIELKRQVPFEISSEREETNGYDKGKETAVFVVAFHGADSPPTARKNKIIIKPQQVGSYVVNHLMEITKQYIGHDNVKNAVIAMPTKFDDRQRIATIQAFLNAGVTVTRILDEPVAAALAYGLQKKGAIEFIMVYDFGGGTLDVSILHVSEGGYVEVIGSDGDDRLGGVDFDAAVVQFLIDHKGGKAVVHRVFNALKSIKKGSHKDFSAQIVDSELDILIESECFKLRYLPLCTLSTFHIIGEIMKIELSAYHNGIGRTEQECLGIPEGSSIPVSIAELCSLLKPVKMKLSSQDYDTACKFLYQRSLYPVQRVFDIFNLERDEIDELVMVGGTTRIPKIRQMMQKELKIDHINSHIDPDLTVAYGAASVID